MGLCFLCRGRQGTVVTIWSQTALAQPKVGEQVGKLRLVLALAHVVQYIRTSRRATRHEVGLPTIASNILALLAVRTQLCCVIVVGHGAARQRNASASLEWANWRAALFSR